MEFFLLNEVGQVYKYEIILYWSEEDGSYIAEVPELAGREIPKPKGKLAFA